MGDSSYDESDHVKEVFVYFGRAYYMANVFETGLALAVLYLDFLREMAVKIKREGKEKFDRLEYEAAFDSFIAQQHSKTLGNLIKRLSELVDIGDNMKDLLAESKSRRDFVAHHFFRDRSMEFVTRVGRDKMIRELELAHDMFENADVSLQKFMEPHLMRYGLTRERVAAEMKRLQRSLEIDTDGH